MPSAWNGLDQLPSFNPAERPRLGAYNRATTSLRPETKVHSAFYATFRAQMVNAEAAASSEEKHLRAAIYPSPGGVTCKLLCGATLGQIQPLRIHLRIQLDTWRIQPVGRLASGFFSTYLRMSKLRSPTAAGG